MKGIIYWVLVVVIGGALGFLIELLANAVLRGQAQAFFLKVLPIGVHALTISVSVSGIIGLVIAYFAVMKFIKK